MRVRIIGAGIGGLTAAIALIREGFDVQVFEQTSILREVGAGLAISPNAVRVLEALGLGEALHRVGVIPNSFDYRDWKSGALLGRVPLAQYAVERWGTFFYHVHRADLHDMLRSAVGSERIKLSSRCVGIDQDRRSITAHLEDGRKVVADVLIGADGIHSVIREHVAGPDQPVWSRQISWRGLAPAAIGRDLGLDTRHHSFWGPRKQFVAFYVSGGNLVNWVGNTQSEQSWEEESWSARGNGDEIRQLFAGWHPQVQGLLDNTENIFKWALFERAPLPTWTQGRVALLGDAAHPMLPYLAQGASQSIEDSLMLARCLSARREDPQSGMELYAASRKDRAVKVQTASRDAGRQIQLAEPAEVQARNNRLSESPEAPVARFDWVWSYNVGAVVI
ncbi:MAG: FAD-dependent monooxygenase [Burkholderiales bacterium]